ncbi:MAG: Holliday junction resolvase-like protein [Candidatus Nanohaloarchaea archaeon]|nr:Holliday junction resolvase-like protein [Candidatus Nanohaloarchaea archaeon]
MVENITIALFVAGAISGGLATYFLMRKWMEQKLERWKQEAGEEIKEEALERSRSVLKGKVGEQLAPFIKGFNYNPADCRFIGSPVDYLIFDGLSEGEVEKLVLADIKTGPEAGLSDGQKKIKDVVDSGEVMWKTLKVETREVEDK